uniref:Uncharacterized protein n=1 Tax=Ditylenchus dipsaci TaxID=166011 RepID=A0A915D037_9BILA
MAFIVPLVRKDYGIYAHRSAQSTVKKQRDRSFSMPIQIKEKSTSSLVKERSPTTTSAASSSPTTCSPLSLQLHSNLPTTIEEEETAAEDDLVIQKDGANTHGVILKSHETIKSTHDNISARVQKAEKERLPRLRTVSSPPDILSIGKDNYNNLPYSTMENDYYPLIPIINPISLDCRLQEPQSPSKRFNVVFRLIGLCSPKN